MLNFLTLENLKIAGAVLLIAMVCSAFGGCLIGCAISRGEAATVPCPVTGGNGCSCGCQQGGQCTCVE